MLSTLDNLLRRLASSFVKEDILIDNRLLFSFLMSSKAKNTKVSP